MIVKIKRPRRKTYAQSAEPSSDRNVSIWYANQPFADTVLQRVAAVTSERVKHGQTPAGSLLETAVNIAVGAGLALVTQVVILDWLWGVPVTWTRNVEMTAAFTAVSVFRSYIVRRVFNWWTTKHDTYK